MYEDLQEELKDAAWLIDKEEIIEELTPLLKKAIEQPHKVAIAFSGGLDSCVLAILNKEFQLYTVGLQGAEDLKYAEEAAKQMHWSLKTKILTADEAELTIDKVIAIFKKHNVEINVTNVGVGCVVYEVLKMAKEDGMTKILGGLGAEETFAGYQRHVAYGENFDTAFIQEQLWQGWKEMEKRDLARDLAIAEELGMTLEAPFLNREVVKYGMQIHPALKINKDQKKIILREVALHLGIPAMFALRKKKAAQYGSKFDRIFLKLAKKNNLKDKKELIEHKAKNTGA